MDYKTYQQVLDLSGPKEAQFKCKAKTAKPSCAVKKRTKSGCLTCRGRKKKCDEDKVDGKCQACIRNFLDCCWPSSVKSEPVATSVAPTETRISPKTVAKPSKGASAYPSPLSSPKLLTVEDKLGQQSTMKVCKPRKVAPRSTKAAQFVVTSFDKDRLLCQVASK